MFAYAVALALKEDGMGLRFQRRMSDHEMKATSRRWQHLVAGTGLEPTRRLDSDASALEIDDRAVLRRAKELCVHNGAVWDAGDLNQAERWERNKIVADDAGRRKFLALAREELFNGSGVA